MTAITNTELMNRVAAGDQNAFRLLAQNIGQKMFRLASRLTNYNQAMAEDAVQEALLKLWRSAPNWQPIATVEAYASRLVYNCCMDMHRRTKRTEEIPEDIAIDDNMLDNLMGREQRKQLLTAIDKLPKNQREAVLLFYMDEQSQRSVAHMMGTTEKSVERLLARARKNLHGLLPATMKEGGYLQ
jgi:RNA polymerase sigma-70 factor (ECF subfamily)